MRGTCIIYARVSTTRQAKKQQSIPDQIRLCREKAKTLGYEVMQVYEEARSASEDASTRPEFNKAVQYCLDNGADFLCLDPDRFARQQIDSVVYKSKLRANGVKIIYALQDFSDDYDGRMVEGILEILAERNAKAQGKRALIGVRSAVANGYAPPGVPPYGYRKVKHPENHHKIIVPHKEEAETVKEIYRMFAEGYSQHAISMNLTRREVFQRNGKAFSQGVIGHILGRNREWYLGSVSRSGVTNPNSHEPIISKELAEQVDRIHDGRNHTLTQARNAPMHPLRGLVFCGYCGHTMIRRPVKQGRYLYYACKSTLSPHIYCPARPRYVPGIDLEAKVLESAIAYVRSKELDEAYANYLSTKEDSLEAVYERISELGKEKKLMEGRKQRLVDAIANGVLSHDEAKGKLEEVRFDIERIEGKIISLENVPARDEVEHNIEHVRYLADVDDETTRRMFLLSIVEAIHLTPASAVITFRKLIPTACMWHHYANV